MENGVVTVVGVTRQGHERESTDVLGFQSMDGIARAR